MAAAPSDVKPMATFERTLRDNLLESEFLGKLVILVAGRTGEGKSTLINSIIELQKEVAKEGASADICTTDVKSYDYPNVIPGVTVTLVDSPGLQDTKNNEQTYIQLMKNHCPHLSLVFYCMKMTDKRLHNDDKVAMQKLYHAFGPKFWERVVFVLTCSNEENCEKKDDRDEEVPVLPYNNDLKGWDNLKITRFKGRFQKRVTEMRVFLKAHVFNPDEANIVENVQFIPAGYHTGTPSYSDPYRLFGSNNWIYDLLKLSCTEIKMKHKFSRLSLNKKIRLAIIIANDIEEKKDETAPKDKQSQNHEVGNEALLGDDGTDGSSGATPLLQEDTHTRLASPNGVLVKEILQKLGFCVLYFNNLSSGPMLSLLQAFQNIDHSQLAMFSLVILSKGTTPHVYGSDNEVVSFEKILNCFSQGRPTPLPRIFFFHLNKTKKRFPFTKNTNEPLVFPSRISKNSIALTVSIDHDDSTVASPAVERFVDVLKSSSSLKPVKKCFEEIETKLVDLLPLCQSEFVDALNENFVFSLISGPSKPRDKIIILENQLKVYRDLWSPIRSNTIDKLIMSKDEVIKTIQTERITRIATSTTSLVIGGGLTIIGLALIPVTFGGSIAIAVTGGAIGGLASLGGVGAFIRSKVASNKQLKHVQQHIQLDQQLSNSINEVFSKYLKAKNEYAATQKEAAARYHHKDDISAGFSQGSEIVAMTTRSIGAGLAVGIEGAAEGTAVAFRTVGRAVGIGLAGASLAVTVPLDLGFIIWHSVHLGKSSQDKTGGKTERDSTVKFIIKKIEETLKSNFTFADAAEHPIEPKAVHNNASYGYLIELPSNCNVKEGKITVSTILSGPFKFPEGTTLVSAIYDVKIDKELKEPLKMKIQHCVSPSSLQKLKYATAVVDFEKKAFVFTTLESGSGTSLQIKESCIVCALYEGPLQINTLKYSAHYYTSRGTTFFNMSVLFSKSLSVFSKYASVLYGVKMETSEFNFKSSPDSTVSDSPCLEFTSTKDAGWSISAHDKTMILKADIDYLGHSDIITLPTLDIDIQRCKDDAELKLECDIRAKGTDLVLPIRIPPKVPSK